MAAFLFCGSREQAEYAPWPGLEQRKAHVLAAQQVGDRHNSIRKCPAKLKK
jgi:hypothetical protein